MSQDQICAHERMLDVHDYCPDCGELRTSWPLEGAKLRARIAELEAELERVKRAAINGMNAATAHGHGLVDQAARLRAESNPDALESERAMNAALTEQLERAELARQDALAELAAALVDAERYRWLRAAHPNTAAIYWNIGHDWIGLRFEQLDTAIDEGRGEA